MKLIRALTAFRYANIGLFTQSIFAINSNSYTDISVNNIYLLNMVLWHSICIKMPFIFFIGWMV